MDTTELLTQIVERAATTSVDTAGRAIAGPLWPILQPVFEPIAKLKLRTPDRKMAELLEAWKREDDRNSEQLQLVTKLVGALEFADFRVMERQNDARRKVVAARAVQFWEQLMLITAAQVDEFAVDEYVFPALQDNAAKLWAALGEAGENGTLGDLISSPEALTMHTAFLQSLLWMSRLPDAPKQPLENWTKYHVMMGMVRLLGFCIEHSLIDDDRIVAALATRVGSLKQLAWSYLQT